MPGQKRKAGAYGGNAKKVHKIPSKLSLQKTIEREILRNAEMNEVGTTAIGNNSLATSPNVVLLNYIAEGDDIYNRRGRRITPRAIDVVYEYISKNTNVGGCALVALVYDGQPNGSTATFGQIFDTSGSPLQSLVFRNTSQYKERFKIAWIDYLPGDGAGDYSSGYVINKRHYYKVPEKINDTRYGGSAAATPDTGAWYLVYTDSVNSTTNATISYNVKFQFTDY